MPDWTPELVVDEDVARRLIASQFPQVGVDRLVPLGEGWDVTAWRAGEWVFRFPRRAVVVEGIEREIAALPLLAPHLSLAVPVPELVGRSTGEYPWPFTGARLLPGREAAESELDEVARAALAEPLAEFLRGLHGDAVARRLDRCDLPHDPTRRADMPHRVSRSREVLEQLGAAAVWRAPALVEHLLDQALALGEPSPPVVVHGDLHLRHLLVDSGRATGVIDWIDLALAPRSVDLVLYWSLLPATGRRRFLAVYGQVGQDDLLRARILALNICGILALYAHEEGRPRLLSGALQGLELTLED